MIRYWLKHIIIAAAFMAAASGLRSQQAATRDPELATLLSSYEAKIARDVEAPLAKAQSELSQNYIKALERSQQDATLYGKLEEAVALKNEKEAVSASDARNLPPLPERVRQLPPLRKKYLEAVQALRTARTAQLKPLRDELVRQLEALAVRMVRAGKADVALEARQLAKTHAEQMPGWSGDWEDHILKVAPKPKGTPIVIKKGNSIATEQSFKPPLEIEVVAKVESLDIRLGYAANQVIFNWERRPDELRIDGGPADKSYIPTQGEIPQGKFVVIRWQVSKTEQKISVDGKVRFEHRGDYSKLDEPISVMAFGSMVTVQSIKTRPIDKVN